MWATTSALILFIANTGATVTEVNFDLELSSPFLAVAVSMLTATAELLITASITPSHTALTRTVPRASIRVLRVKASVRAGVWSPISVPSKASTALDSRFCGA